MKLMRVTASIHFSLQSLHDPIQQSHCPLTFIDLLGGQSVLPDVQLAVLIHKIEGERSLSTAAFQRNSLLAFFREEAFKGCEQKRTESAAIRINIRQVVLLEQSLEKMAITSKTRPRIRTTLATRKSSTRKQRSAPTESRSSKEMRCSVALPCTAAWTKRSIAPSTLPWILVLLAMPFVVDY